MGEFLSVDSVESKTDSNAESKIDSTATNADSATDSTLGEVHFTLNPSALIEQFRSQISPVNLAVFDMDLDAKGVLKIETARAIIEHAYLTTPTLRTIIISAREYNVEAQNALLKVLEEPPARTKFVLIAKNKNSILDTIRSRLISKNHKEQRAEFVFPLNPARLELADIYTYCQNAQKSSSRDEVRERIEALLFALKNSGLKPDAALLEAFDKAIIQNQNDERESYIFLPLLLRIYALRMKR